MHFQPVALAVTLFGVLQAAPAPSPQVPAPAPPANYGKGPGSSTYWVADIQRQGKAAFNTDDPEYKVFRNVRTDCGVAGDGVTDDTVALNNCLALGNRCGKDCDSTTITPAILYFPSGTYLVSKPLEMHYYTHMIGDALSLPVIKAAANFEGMAVLDSDPYDYTNFGKNWFTNQNNFFRQVRNFVIDLTAMPMSRGSGIHWQVAQATSLQNIRFEMVQGGDAANAQIGVFMDNGSGGFMADLTFNGGNYGMFLGNQQFTTRNLTFNNCNTAIFMNWNWLWTFKSVNVNNCKVGLDMANSPQNQTVGSVVLIDSTFVTSGPAVNVSSFAEPANGGTLVIDNVDFTGSSVAVQNFDGAMMLAGGGVVQSWTQGAKYMSDTKSKVAEPLTPASSKPAALLTPNGKIFERVKPQFEDYPSSAFRSVKAAGAKGDGVTDDSDAIQTLMNSIQPNEILYFDHGAYIITKTINVPKDIKITGEVWPLIMANGPFFGDQNNPQPVFSVGNPGEVGAAEITELMFETKGPAPGAVMIQWNSGATVQGSNGMWDVNIRIGGSAGTELQHSTCAKNPNDTIVPNPACIGAHTMLHLTKQSSVYIENCWYWVADHELDEAAKPAQIDIYNGRGVFIESEGPVWMYGSSSEHSVLYNYQLKGAKNIYIGAAQTESPYFQSNPPAPAPFLPVQGVDPMFEGGEAKDKKAWGLRVIDSSDVLIYGAGLYSFFENYDQVCVGEQNCQNTMIEIGGAINNLDIFGLSTKASVNMVSTVGGFFPGGSDPSAGYSRAPVTSLSVLDVDNRSNFCATLALWRAA